MRLVDHDDVTSSLHLRGSGIIATAPHGGDIEQNTDRQARLLAEEIGCDFWVVEGEGPNAFDKWHITSSEISPREFPKLSRAMSNDYYRGVSFHGFSGDEIVVGGTCDLSVRESVASELAPHGQTIVAGPGSGSSGYSDVDGSAPENFINRLTDGVGGIQIEQPLSIRENSWQEVVEDIASALG